MIQQVHHDPNIHGALSEQQENIGQIVNEIYRLRDELDKLKLTLKQGLILIDETCAKHAAVLEGLQSLQERKLGQIRGYMRLSNDYQVKWRLSNRKPWNLRRIHP